MRQPKFLALAKQLLVYTAVVWVSFLVSSADPLMVLLSSVSWELLSL